MEAFKVILYTFVPILLCSIGCVFLTSNKIPDYYTFSNKLKLNGRFTWKHSINCS